MTRRQVLRVLRAVGSLLATLALVVAVPVLLVTQVGWPFPTSVPSLGSLERAIQSGISDQVVVKTLAIIAWIAWLQLSLALVVEAVGVARRRGTRHIPVLPGFQTLAAQLLAGMLMVASTAQSTRADTARPPIAALVTARPALAVEPDDLLDAFVAGDTVQSMPTSGLVQPSTIEARPTVVVQRHDTYWGIAERTLGDGLRWREIFDLNVGRTLPDGTTIAADDETLHAGWELVLPGHASPEWATAQASAGGPPRTPVDESNATVVVQDGANLWTIAEHRLEQVLGHEPVAAEVDAYWRAVIDANQERYVEPGNPNLILPGQVLVLPPTTIGSSSPLPAVPLTEVGPAPSQAGVDETAPSGGLPETPTTVPEPNSHDSAPSERGSTSARATHTTDKGADDDTTVPVGVVLGGLSSIALALGLKRLLNRRRRRFANDHAGQVAGRTPAGQHGLHQAVVAQADEESINDLQAVLGSLATALAETSSTRRPRVVRHSSDSVEVLLDQPDQRAAAGWTSNEDGTVWTLDRESDTELTDDRPLCAAPVLVTLGQPEGDAQLYLDLEADGLVSLTGDSSVAVDLARSIATELALGPLAETLRVITVGDFVPPEAEILEHLTVVQTWENVADDVRAWATQSHDALNENDWPNTFVARAHDPDHDALVPLAVIANHPPPPALSECLRSTYPSAVAVVAVGTFTGEPAVVRCDEDALNLDWIDLACAPQEVRADELGEMCRLLESTDDPYESELVDGDRVEPATTVASNGAPPTPGHAQAVDSFAAEPEPPTFDVLVRLLGDITVEGGTPLKPKASAVVAYLALHRSVTTERLEEACWFGSDGTSHRKRLRDVMTECRDALGSQHFPANRSGTYTADSGVRTDLDLFEWHIERAAHVEPAESVEHYRAALDLVTGKPFSYPNAARASYGWVDFEHHATEWEYRVACVAQACAEMHLDADDAGEAITMLRQVLPAVPLNSALIETLMRAHIENDDRSGAERVYQEHAAALEQAKLGDPGDSIEELRVDLKARRVDAADPAIDP